MGVEGRTTELRRIVRMLFPHLQDFRFTVTNVGAHPDNAEMARYSIDTGDIEDALWRLPKDVISYAENNSKWHCVKELLGRSRVIQQVEMLNRDPNQPFYYKVSGVNPNRRGIVFNLSRTEMSYNKRRNLLS